MPIDVLLPDPNLKYALECKGASFMEPSRPGDHHPLLVAILLSTRGHPFLLAAQKKIALIHLYPIPSLLARVNGIGVP